MEVRKEERGLAPFASVEDLSDESPPEEKCRLGLPSIREDPTPNLSPTMRALPASITPRIDISRASSSSHHDDSSPERELFAAGGAEGGNGVKYGLGFTEEMALELRSSTEELDFQDPLETDTKSRRKKLTQQHAVNKYESESQGEKDCKERKDSACSEGGLLFIGGRTSRLSSIGSAASGGSAASHISGGSAMSGHSGISCHSHMSGTSHLSAVSNVSRASRCSSPHRMMLETSFCGPKPIPTVSLEAEYPPRESVEAALLARNGDPKGAVLPPDDSSQAVAKPYRGKTSLQVKSGSGRASGSETKPKPRSSSERIQKSSSAVHAPQTRSSSARSSSRPKDSKPKRNDDLVRIIPLHGSLDEPDDTPDSEIAETTTETERSVSPPEYGIYIPLKGPEIVYSKKDEAVKTEKPKKPEIEESDLVQFISLHGEDDEELEKRRLRGLQPNCRNGQNVHFKSRTEESVRAKREKTHIKKARTPDSDGSGDSKTKRDSKNKSVFSLFKKSGKEKEAPSHKTHETQRPTLDPKITNVEFTFKQEDRRLEGDSIIIPLHSPDSIVEPLVLREPSPEEKDPPKESIAQYRDPSPSVSQTLETTKSKMAPQKCERNVIVVDVINEDNREQHVLNTEPAPELALEKVELTLEQFEKEPKVLKSQCSPSIVEETKEEVINKENIEEVIETIDEKPAVAQKKSKENSIEENIEAQIEIVSHVSHETDAVENISTQTEPENQRSSESEADSEAGPIRGNSSEICEEDDTERKGLFHQTDSIEDELPYVPTTLPLERSIAIPIIPVKQRISEVKTCPIDRPRSTTPINPAMLDDYASTHEDNVVLSSPGEKMQITLPRTDSFGKSKSPGRGKPWTQFAEQCLQSPKETRRKPPSPPGTPPPLPPRSTTPASSWVCFDELPEKRRAPKRITTLPTRAPQHPPASNIVYSYVNPEECSCECHENQGKLNNAQCPSDKGHCSYNQKDGRTEREKHYRS